MQSKLSMLKNMIWAVAIMVCLVALLVGFIVASAAKNPDKQEDGTLYLDGVPKDKGGSKDGEGTAEGEEGEGAASFTPGEIKVLPESSDAGQAYIDSLTFLTDSSLIGLRDNGLLTGGIATSQVWASEPGNIPASTIAECNIVYPGDGTVMPATAAAGLAKPKTLVVALGMDGLADVTKSDFVANYTALINGIKAQSPDTTIILCGPTSVASYYPSLDGITVAMANDLEEWVKAVCSSTGAYFADLGSVVCDVSGTLNSDFAGANGKTINSAGLSQILQYLRTHKPE